ncbi:TIGR02206 family membrane protein [Luteolibacter sp. GHJ8]|uniref:TIGR02206 family membrane protein n=1 Tax=Luteolibacter rhizosphaerae TaxID=2989719 RepID=A0ABT3G1U5_9BACT|nr:TIGR02206 family membrane protein [Luteolibacter rhizosphaerae]MCW1913797.1 TIGR02206 family membrane protein [Luteolibacter rhizosphaerae]
MPPVFTPFSAMHGWALVAGFAGIALLIVLGRRGEKQERIARFILALLCLSAFGYTQAAWSTVHIEHDLDSSLPLHLCDLAAFIAGFALITGKRLLITLTYFWGLAATIQALATPAISVGYPHPAFIAFFVHHFAVVGAAFYFPIVLGWRVERPWWREPLRALLLANAYLAVAMLVNLWLGTNFGFASRKPVNPSLLDHMGPWPVYLIWMQVLAAVLFSLVALPVLRRRTAAAPVPVK